MTRNLLTGHSSHNIDLRPPKPVHPWMQVNDSQIGKIPQRSQICDATFATVSWMTQQSALSHCWGGGIKRLTESALILQRVRSCFLTGDVGCAGSHCFNRWLRWQLTDSSVSTERQHEMDVPLNQPLIRMLHMAACQVIFYHSQN